MINLIKINLIYLKIDQCSKNWLIPNRNLRQTPRENWKRKFVPKLEKLQVHEWPIGNDTVKSKMEIDPATQKDAGYYECQADNQYAVDRRGFKTDYVMFSY